MQVFLSDSYNQNMTNERFGLSVDRAIGITIEQYMFFTGERRADIGRLLGVTGQSVSSRLHGRARWTAEDLMAVAAHFGVSVDDLLPVVGVDGSWTPAPLRTGAAPASAGAALEPPERIELSTYSLRVNRSAD